MKRRDFLAGAMAMGIMTAGSALGSPDPKPPLETLTEGMAGLGDELEDISEGLVSIFQEKMVNDIYLLRLDGTLEQIDKVPEGKVHLKTYGIDGGFVPPLKTYLTRNQVGYSLRHNDDVILLDAGAKTILKDKEILENADAMLLSHIHLDHIIHIWQIAENMPAGTPIYSPSRISGLNNLKIVGPRSHQKIKSFHIEKSLTMHSIVNYAYKIHVGGKTICYTGDANYTKGLGNFCKDSDLILTECTHNDKNFDLIDSHMSPDEVIKLAYRAQPRLMLMSHFKYVTPEKAEELVKEEFQNVMSAKPGMTIVIE